MRGTGRGAGPHYLWLAAGLGLAACDGGTRVVELPATPLPGDSLVNYYRTPHFVFVYDTSVYGRGEVVADGKVKEAHLARIDRELAVEFRGEILVRLISESGGPWSGEADPIQPYLLTETRGYFVEDNGHEVAHAVSYATLGRPYARSFFVEGLAVAHELDARPKWARLCRDFPDTAFMAGQVALNEDASQSLDVAYPLAGAYVEWMEQAFGVEAFKKFYRSLSDYPMADLSHQYREAFGLDAEAMHGRFAADRFDSTWRSQTCVQRLSP